MDINCDALGLPLVADGGAVGEISTVADYNSKLLYNGCLSSTKHL